MRYKMLFFAEIIGVTIEEYHQKLKFEKEREKKN